MKRAWLALSLLLCACPEARPFGIETTHVELTPGGSVTIGYRVNGVDAGVAYALAPTVEQPEVSTGVTAAQTGGVYEASDESYSGGLEVNVAPTAPTGSSTVRFGPHVITVQVTAPTVTLEPSAMRRSTVAAYNRQVWAVAEDGTLWGTTDDGGVARLPGVSGVTAVTAFIQPAFRTLESGAVDVRADDSGRLVELQRDGRVPKEGLVPGLEDKTGIAAVRPFSFVVPGVDRVYVDHFVRVDGTTEGNEHFPGTGVRDVSALGMVTLRSDGSVLERVSGGGFASVFTFPGVTDFDSTVDVTFDGSSQVHPYVATWMTPDGQMWAVSSRFDTFGVAPPPGVTVVDVFAKNQQLFALSDVGQLWTAQATPGTTWRLLPFPSVRSARPGPDVGVFCDGVPLNAGQTLPVPLRVTRQQYDGALTVTLRDPKGEVTAQPLIIPAGATSATFSVSAPSTFVASVRELEVDVRGDGMQRTALFWLTLPRTPRQRTVAGDVVVKTDGTVWRVSGTPAQVMGLSNIVSVTEQLALDANGVVTELNTLTVKSGLPHVVAIAQSRRNGQDLALALGDDGVVSYWGRVSLTAPNDPTVQRVMGLPRIVDVGGDGNAAALAENGDVFLIPSLRKVGNDTARLGLVFDGNPAGIDRNLSLTALGVIRGLSSSQPATFFTGFAVTASGQACNVDVGGPGVTTCLLNSEGAEYVSESYLVVKTDGTLWRRESASSMTLQPVPGVTGVALTR